MTIKSLLLLMPALLLSCSGRTTSLEIGGGDTCAVEDTIIVEVEKETPAFVSVDTTESLTIYMPQYGRVDLVCETMPAPSDSSVLMVCEAAFTGQLLATFKHGNIAGHHVSDGTLYKGYPCKANTGAFVWYADSGLWEFAVGKYSRLLDEAQRRGGMAFGQMMLILDGKRQTPAGKIGTKPNLYRALAEYKSRLCIIDARRAVPLREFVDNMLAMGVKNAIYLDMGSGWNYSFYRNAEGEAIFIHKKQIKYTTNWITFYK